MYGYEAGEPQQHLPQNIGGLTIHDQLNVLQIAIISLDSQKPYLTENGIVPVQAVFERHYDGT